MTTVALFHSVLGARPGFLAGADTLRSAGHEVLVVDLYGGTVFDDYETAFEHLNGIGFPALMEQALAATAELPAGFVTMGFSNGAGVAELVAGRHPGAAGVVMSGGALDPQRLGIEWPAGVPGQVHTTVDDPWRTQSGIDAAVAAAAAAGARVEVFDYPGSGHLFADASKADEYQPVEAELMWSRVLRFLAGLA